MPPREEREREAPDDQALLVAITMILLAGLALHEIGRRLTLLLAPIGIPPLAVVRLLSILGEDGTQLPVPAPDPRAPALSTMQRTAAGRRALYILAAARRLAGGGSVEAERRLFRAHQAAERRRRAAAARVDAAAKRFGPVLGWWAVRDDRTTPACFAAHGSNFSALRPPAIGWPGTIHAGNCRCRPVAPWPEGQMLPSSVPAAEDVLLTPPER